MKNSVNDRMRIFFKTDCVDGGVHTKYPDHFSVDGVHLNESGQKKLKKIVMKTFKKTV
ncbi:hypothetical protein ACF0H5_009889 [Mactra antiquata]